MSMQKFKAKLKNVPMDASQVRSSTNSVLNKDQSLSVQNKVLTLNNLEVNPLQHKGEKNLRVSSNVYVLNKRGKALMPCSPRKARVLIKNGEAKVIKNYPLVIQLQKSTGESVQKCTLGIDTGYQNVGFSVISDKKEIVCGTLVLDNKTSDRLKSKAMYRRLRRRKLWYRKPRFNNRANARRKGWLPPSIQRRFDTQIKFINKIKSLIPIDKLIIETANFDIQKIENPDIKGIQYKQDSKYEYQNMRSFLMVREHGKCQICGKEFSKGNSSHIHHIILRSKGGTDREKNLALLHEKCHNKLHKNGNLNILKKNKQYKDATFMNIVRWKYREVFPDCFITFGNETFVNRNNLRLEKTHYNDAFVIAGGIDQIKSVPINYSQHRINNRILQFSKPGKCRSIRRQRYSIRPYDLVTINNKIYTSRGCSSYGKIIMCTDGKIKFDIGIKKIKKIFHIKSIHLNF